MTLASQALIAPLSSTEPRKTALVATFVPSVAPPTVKMYFALVLPSSTGTKTAPSPCNACGRSAVLVHSILLGLNVWPLMSVISTESVTPQRVSTQTFDSVAVPCGTVARMYSFAQSVVAACTAPPSLPRKYTSP